MATETITKSAIGKKAKNNATHQNGSQTPNEHLEKANKAMSKAWALIEGRKDKRD